MSGGPGPRTYTSGEERLSSRVGPLFLRRLLPGELSSDLLLVAGPEPAPHKLRVLVAIPDQRLELVGVRPPGARAEAQSHRGRLVAVGVGAVFHTSLDAQIGRSANRHPSCQF